MSDDAVESTNEHAAYAVKVDSLEDALQKYTILWRKELKTVAKILEIDKEEKRAVYEIHSGPDKGKKFRSRYDATQPVDIYDDDNVIMAALES